MARRWTQFVALCAPCLATGCLTAERVPKPEPAVATYAAAVQAGHVDAVYAMMSEESRRAMSKDELARILREQKAELKEHAEGLTSAERVLKARAEIRFSDGETVTLHLDGDEGAFRVTAADALPAAATSPAQALGQLRKVLARRSYQGLLQVLSPRTRAAIEQDLRILVEGLEQPESLDIEVVGDKASVSIPGGHRVNLVRKNGVWHVDDFF